MKTINDAEKWYESQPYETRRKLQDEFGNDGISNREVKFYQWILDNYKN